MKQQPIVEDAEQPELKTTPGERLRRAREELGLSLEDVAFQLKLDVSKINDLETGDASSISAPVFLAGYLRSYARLVNLPSDELVADFDVQTNMASASMNPAASAATNNFGKVPDNLPSHMSMANKGWGGFSVVVSVIIIAVVAGVLWWNNQGDIQVVDNPPVLESASPALTEIQVEEVETNSVEMLSEQSVDGSESATDSEAQAEPGPSKLEVLEPDVSKSDEQTGTDSAAGTLSSIQDDSELPVIDVFKTDETLTAVEENSAELTAGELTSSTEASSQQQMLSDTLAGVEEAAVTAENGLEYTQQPQEQLTLFFSQDSWVEVTDAMGQRLMYRLGKVGEIATVSGVAPFQVHLGYAPGVRVSLNGEPYDLTNYGNRRTVRFQLGGE